MPINVHVNVCLQSIIKIIKFQTSETGASVNNNDNSRKKKNPQPGSSAQCKERRPADPQSQPSNKAAISSSLLLKSPLPVWFQLRNMASTGSLRGEPRRRTRVRAVFLSKWTEGLKPQVCVGAGWLWESGFGSEGQDSRPPVVFVLIQLRSHWAWLHDSAAAHTQLCTIWSAQSTLLKAVTGVKARACVGSCGQNDGSKAAARFGCRGQTTAIILSSVNGKKIPSKTGQFPQKPAVCIINLPEMHFKRQRNTQMQVYTLPVKSVNVFYFMLMTIDIAVSTEGI